MATLIKTHPRVIDVGSGTIQSDYRVADNQAWLAGALLRVNQSGLLVECATGDTSVNALALKVQTDPNDDTTLADVLWLADDTILEMNLHDDTDTTALANVAKLGQHFGLHVGNNNATTAISVHNVDLDETSSNVFQITEIGSDYNQSENSTADLYGRVRVKVLSTVIQAAPAA